jgi:hypothetical protein
MGGEMSRLDRIAIDPEICHGKVLLDNGQGLRRG